MKSILIKLAYARKLIVALVLLLTFLLVLLFRYNSLSFKNSLIANHVPAIITSGRVQALPAGDSIDIGSGNYLGSGVNIGSGEYIGGRVNLGVSTSTDLLSIRGSTNEISLTDTVSNAVRWAFHTNGASLLDIDPVASTGTEAISLRLFRHTITTGVKTLTLSNGNSATTNIILDPNNHSTFRSGIYIAESPTGDNPGGGATTWIDVQNLQTGLTINTTGVRTTGSGNTYNTTSSKLTSRGAQFEGSGVRTSGTNPLVTIGVDGESRDSQQSYGGYFIGGNSGDGLASVGVYSTAPGGSLSIAGYFDVGDFQANGHTLSFGSVPSLSGACTSGGGSSIVGTDTDFKFVTGASSVACVISFVNAIAWTHTPICEIWPEGQPVNPTCTISISSVNCTTNLSSSTYNGHCGGIGISTPTQPN